MRQNLNVKRDWLNHNRQPRWTGLNLKEDIPVFSHEEKWHWNITENWQYLYKFYLVLRGWETEQLESWTMCQRQEKYPRVNKRKSLFSFTGSRIIKISFWLLTSSSLLHCPQPRLRRARLVLASLPSGFCNKEWVHLNWMNGGVPDQRRRSPIFLQTMMKFSKIDIIKPEIELAEPI